MEAVDVVDVGQGSFEDAPGGRAVEQLELGPVMAALGDPDETLRLQRVEESIVAVELQHDGVASEAALDLAQRPFDQDLPFRDQADVVAELLDLFHAVRGEEDRPAVFFEFEDDVAQQRRVDRVEAAEGFVEDDQARLGQDRSDELELLLHALGELLGFLAGPVAEVETVEPVADPLGGLGAGPALEFGEVAELFAHLEFFVEAAFFGQIPHLLLTRRPDELPVEADRALVRDRDVGDHADR